MPTGNTEVLLKLELSEEEQQSLSFARLRLQDIGVVTADAMQPDGWWDGTAFDAILIDAPCSATGIVRQPSGSAAAHSTARAMSVVVTAAGSVCAVSAMAASTISTRRSAVGRRAGGAINLASASGIW